MSQAAYLQRLIEAGGRRKVVDLDAEAVQALDGLKRRLAEETGKPVTDREAIQHALKRSLDR